MFHRQGATELKSRDELKKFSAAYECLGKTSSLLVRTEDGHAEVWETRGQMLTVVDFIEVKFFTKRRADNPEEYEQAKRSFNPVFRVLDRGVAA